MPYDPFIILPDPYARAGLPSFHWATMVRFQEFMNMDHQKNIIFSWSSAFSSIINLLMQVSSHNAINNKHDFIHKSYFILHCNHCKYLKMSCMLTTALKSQQLLLYFMWAYFLVYRSSHDRTGQLSGNHTWQSFNHQIVKLCVLTVLTQTAILLSPVPYL